MEHPASPHPMERLSERLDSAQLLAPAAIVHELVEDLGAQLVAAIADARRTATIRSWERGLEIPRQQEALIAALQATRAIKLTASAQTARVWFISENRSLGKSPLETIREGSADSRRNVVRAAVGFALG